MLALYTNRAVRRERPPDGGEAQLPPDVVWIDLVNPDAKEIAFVEQTTGVAVPSAEELSEIESSSRLRAANGALYLSAPLIRRGDADEPMATPVGFLLTQDRPITIRFAELPSYVDVQKRTIPPDAPRLTSAGIFCDLVEAIVDRLADALERIAGELDNLSHRLFRAGPTEPLSRRRSATESADLRVTCGASGTMVTSPRRSATACSGSAGSFRSC